MINDLSPRQIVGILESHANPERIQDFLLILGYIAGHQTGNNPNEPKVLESAWDTAKFCGSFRKGFHAALESEKDFQEVYYTVSIYRDDVKDWESRYSARLAVDINEVDNPIIIQIGKYISSLWPSKQRFSYHVHEYHIASKG
jgi:hypothetical protein